MSEKNSRVTALATTDAGVVANVSVVIPLYNHQAYIEQTITSVLEQTRAPREILVIDDGSQDRSAEIVARLAESTPGLVLHRQANQGTYATLNRGITLARGECIAILNSDDLFHAERLDRCLRVLDEDSQVAAVVTGIEVIDGRGRRQDDAWYRQAREFYERSGDLALALINGNFFMTTSNLVIRRSAYERVGPFCGLRYAHDLDFFLRLLAEGETVRIIDQPLLFYRRHTRNTIGEDAGKVKAEWAAVVAHYLLRRWRRGGVGGSRGTEWVFQTRLAEVAERHRLMPLILHFLAWNGLHGGQTTPDAWMSDGGFAQFIREAAR